MSAADTYPNPRAIFFDVDYTLVYPGPVFQAEGYRRICAEYGIRVEVERFDAAVAAASIILDEVEGPVYNAALFVHYNATIIERMGGRGASVIDVAQRLYEQWAANHHFEMYDDVEPTLNELIARGFKIGVISNTHRSLDEFREHFQLSALITTAISSAAHGYMKPHPSIFESALQDAGVAPGDAVMVGDSLKADIEGATQAGMRAILLRRSGEKPPNLPPAVEVITTLRDLIALL